MIWIQKDIIEPLQTCKEKANGKIDDWYFDNAIYKSIRILKSINKYVEKHGDIALRLNSEWLYRDNKGQRDAIDLVATILEDLSEYTDENE